MAMTTLKAYANYGVLAHEKKTLYTIGGSAETATYSEEVEVILPEGFEVDENVAGGQLITVPGGETYLANEIFYSSNGCPELSWYDSEQKVHRVKCQVVDIENE